MKTIVYLHGAMSTPLTFQYIKESLLPHRAIMIEYDYNIKLSDALKSINSMISEELMNNPTCEFDIISHSLGGLMAVNVASNKKFNVKKVVTISAPFGGSEAAWYLKFLYPFTPLFREIAPYSTFVTQTLYLLEKGKMAKLNNDGCFLPIVTNTGKGIMLKAENDKIVTLASQVTMKNVKYYYVELNHFEVLQSPAIVRKIKSFLWN